MPSWALAGLALITADASNRFLNSCATWLTISCSKCFGPRGTDIQNMQVNFQRSENGDELSKELGVTNPIQTITSFEPLGVSVLWLNSIWSE